MPINVEHITVSDPEHHYQILQDVTCQIKDTQISLVLGQAGAGKSTLLDTLSGLIELDQGTLLYDQSALWHGKRLNPALQFSTGNVFQYPEQQLFARTVQGEFDYSLHPLKLKKSAVRERTLTALKDMGLSEQLTSESPLTLSTGQKRRVALASTLATQPTWLFLDEPTAGLDPEAVQLLIEYLLAWKQNACGGIIIATHDIDALLPIADAIIVLHRGCLIANLTPQELCFNPHVLVEAEIGIPTSIELLMTLHEHGIAASACPLSAYQYAQHIQQHRLSKTTTNGSENAFPLGKKALSASIDQSTIQHCSSTAVPIASADRSNPDLDENFVYSLDPRSKWLFYVLVSIGIFMQNNLAGLVLGSTITLVSVLISRVPMREITPVMRPFSVLIVLSVSLSGIQFSPVPHQWYPGILYFSLQSALFTFTQLYKILLVMILGVLLPATTSQLKMKRGLEQSLSALRYLKLPVEAFSLGASLMLHFIPVLMKEAQRFSRITRARGKRHTKMGTIRVRDMSALLIPLIISVLQLGSDLALAMEARGYTHIGLLRTASYELKMRRADVWTMIVGILVITLLIVLEYARM